MTALQEHIVIARMIDNNTKVLDLGCGEGDLLTLLSREKGVKGQGVEIDEKAIYSCVEKGLNVFHDDLDNGLIDYSDNSFDYVIMNQTLQEVRSPQVVLREALRVGRKVIVGFPNFAYWKARFQLFFRGRAPVTSTLPHQWYDTPNLHFLSIADFRDYCREERINILQSAYLPDNIFTSFLPNLFALSAILMIDMNLSNNN